MIKFNDYRMVLIVKPIMSGITIPPLDTAWDPSSSLFLLV